MNASSFSAGRGKKLRSARGVALITVLMVLLILTAIAFGLMYMANTETMINSNFRSVQQTYAASRAGLQEARERLMFTNVPPHRIDGPLVLPGNPNSIVYIINPRPGELVNPLQAGPFLDDELCQENFVGLGPMASPPDGQPCTSAPPAGSVAPLVLSDAPFAGTTAALGYKWVRITAKANNTACTDPACTGGHPVANPSTTANTIPICWDGAHQLPMPAGYVACDIPPGGGTSVYKPVWVLTSLSINADGASRMTQMEVAHMPPVITNAALDTRDLVNVSGASVTINGYDNCQCECTVAKGSAVPTCNNRTTGAACTGSTYAIYTTQTVSPAGAIIAGTSPAYREHVPVDQFPYDANALADAYTRAAGAVDATRAPYNYSCAGTPPNCGVHTGGTFGGLPNPFPPNNVQNPPGAVDQVTIIPGSVTLTAHGEGSGVLVVKGDAEFQAGFKFYGLIIVTGRLTLRGSGVGQDYNILGGIIAGQGSSTDLVQGGVNLQYDLCALRRSQLRQPPDVLAFRELPY